MKPDLADAVADAAAGRIGWRVDTANHGPAVRASLKALQESRSYDGYRRRLRKLGTTVLAVRRCLVIASPVAETSLRSRAYVRLYWERMARWAEEGNDVGPITEASLLEAWRAFKGGRLEMAEYKAVALYTHRLGTAEVLAALGRVCRNARNAAPAALLDLFVADCHATVQAMDAKR